MERNPLDDLSRDALIAIILDLRERIVVLEQRDREQTQRIEELEKKNPTVRLDEAYSLNAETKRRDGDAKGGKKRRRKQKSSRRGRITTAEKLAQASIHENVFPDDVPRDKCRLKYSRPVWRILDGCAVRVAYHVHAGPNGRVPQIPGVPKRGEFGREILIATAFQHYVVGLSLDKVIAEQEFFWNLRIRKSQADAMLNRLMKDWLPEFDRLCELLAVSAVVYADETSWSINSVWAFLSEQARVTIFGCRKDGATLAMLLDKNTFAGILVSDDAAVYQGFSRSQKCWAHLIRKAIRLTLLKPNRPRYRRFLDSLLDIYRRGKAIAADKRLSESTRKSRVDDLVNTVCACTGDRHADGRLPGDDAEKDFVNLTREIVRLLGDDELFTFVIHPEAAGTNNESERSLRSAALDRRTGRTSKTPRGARRRTVIVSVLDSLRRHLPTLTLKSVQEEISRWYRDGISCFGRLVESLQLPPPPEASRLDRLVPDCPAS